LFTSILDKGDTGIIGLQGQKGDIVSCVKIRILLRYLYFNYDRVPLV